MCNLNPLRPRSDFEGEDNRLRIILDAWTEILYSGIVRSPFKRDDIMLDGTSTYIESKMVKRAIGRSLMMDCG